jgi:hypothetical protein
VRLARVSDLTSISNEQTTTVVMSRLALATSRLELAMSRLVMTMSRLALLMSTVSLHRVDFKLCLHTNVWVACLCRGYIKAITYLLTYTSTSNEQTSASNEQTCTSDEHKAEWAGN